MKKIILIFILLFPFRGLGGLTFAQKDSVKVLFSEETVEKFEQSEVISMAERMGVKRPVKSSLWAGIEVTPFISKQNNSGLFLSYEQKIKDVFSVNFSLKLKPNRTDSPLSFEIEPRWYFDMHKRVRQNDHAYNTTGKYLSLRYKQGRLNTDKSTFLVSNPYVESSAYSLNLGQQFGNVMDVSLSAGYKNIRESYVDGKGFMRNNAQSPKSGTWFLASSFRVGLGLSYPKIKPQKYEKFEKIAFSSSNFDVNHLWKVNLTDILYIDKYSQLLKVDIAYERRIANTLFSTNTMILGSINRFSTFNQIGKIDSMINKVSFTLPVWSSERKSNFYSNFQLTQQLRYYMKRKELRQGKSGKNFNGVYTGLEASYFNTSLMNDVTDKTPIPRQLKDSQAFGVGAVFGFQNQFNNKLYFDWSTSFLLTKNTPTNSVLFSRFGNVLNTFSLKIGFVR